MKMVSNVKIAGSHQKKFNKKVGLKRNTTTDYPTSSSSQTVKKANRHIRADVQLGKLGMES